MRHHLLRLPFMLLLAPAILATQAADPFAAAVTAHGGAAVAAVQRIRITGQSTRGTTTVPVTISAIMDGRLRLDYGQTAARSIVRAPAPFDLVNGQRIPKPAHTGAFAQLDMLSILGVVPYLAAPVIHRGRRAAPAGALDRYETGTARQQVHYRRTLEDRVEVDMDVATGRVAGIARRQFAEFAEESLDHPFTLGYAFSNFGTVNGLVFPFRIEKSINGVVRETIVVNSIEINPVLAGDLFTR